MAAIFYSYSDNGDVFKQQIGIPPVRVDFLENFQSKDSMALITEVSVQTTETIQFFITFDDIIKYFHFGAGLGTINIAGVIFMDCDGNMPGISSLYDIISGIRGLPVVISMGGKGFTGVVTNTTVNVVAEPTTMANFNLNIAMTEHDLGGTEAPNVSC